MPANATLEKNEKKTLYVIILTLIMMIIEIVYGTLTNSMALLTDGWHMASHVGALSISYSAYRFARSKKINNYFTFGAGKFIPLGGYTSAIALTIVSIIMGFESFMRLLHPLEINFKEALIVSSIGLVVNILSAVLLSHHHHGEDPQNHTHDHNLKSAYMHVLADTLTSLMAIIALLLGQYYRVIWADAAMGIIASVVILKWAYGLCRQTAWELLDGHDKNFDYQMLHQLLEQHNINIVDLHVWRISPTALALEISIETKQLQGAKYYKKIIKQNFDIGHITIEENLVGK